jgi:protein phosphatase
MPNPEQPPSLEQSPEPLDIHALSIANEDHPDRNEDALFARSVQQCFGVLDGMGGHPAGDRASTEAKKVIIAEVEKLSDTMSLEETADELSRILDQANKCLLEMANNNSDLKGMGSTVSLVKIWEGPTGERKAVVANVGDSRVYIQRIDGTLEQITLDDGIVRATFFGNRAARVMQTKLNNVTNSTDLTDEERDMLRHRSQISNHLGNATIEVRIHAVDVTAGDTILVVSDGVSDNLTDNEMSKILTEAQTSAQATQRLIGDAQTRSKEAHMRAKHDDMSAIVAKIL